MNDDVARTIAAMAKTIERQNSVIERLLDRLDRAPARVEDVEAARAERAARVLHTRRTAAAADGAVLGIERPRVGEV